MALLIIYLASMAICVSTEVLFCRMVGMKHEVNANYFVPLLNTVVALMMVLSILMWLGKGRN